jgi:ArsR family transcriptional regulator
MARSGFARCATSSEVVSFHEVLKVICDINRLRIICLLFSGEKCVCAIEEGLGISQPLASHHLGVLRDAGLVEVRREATWSYYSLNREAIEALNRTFNKFLGSEKLPDLDSACAT